MPDAGVVPSRPGTEHTCAVAMLVASATLTKVETLALQVASFLARLSVVRAESLVASDQTRSTNC